MKYPGTVNLTDGEDARVAVSVGLDKGRREGVLGDNL